MAGSRSLLLRWFRGTWLAWLVLLALLVGMHWFVIPRIDRFLDFWYGVPADAPMAAQAATLRLARQEAMVRSAWQAGAAAVGLLFVLPLLFALFEKPAASAATATAPDGKAGSPAPDDAIEFESAGLNLTAADITQIRRPGEQDSSAMHIGQGGRYRIDRLIAGGGMGLVHQGYDRTLHRVVAIKELNVNQTTDAEQAERFRQEARALAGMVHSNIVPVYDLLEDRNRFWIVMELLSGGDLDQYIQANAADVAEAVRVIRAVAEGLAYAHGKGIVHRDIKPMNILFNSDRVPKLVDFGIAKLVQVQQSTIMTQEGMSLGSPTYMSPEQAIGSKDIDARADIYALGVTFYKLLTGQPPFTGDAQEVMLQHLNATPPVLQALNPAVDAALEAVVLKMMAKQREARYQSMEDVIKALDGLKAA